MKIQKLAIGAAAATVFLFLVDYVWYAVLMKDSMNMPNARPEPDFMWLVISYIVFSVGFVSIYGAWSGGSSKVNSGLNFGIWTGIMVGLGMNLMWYSLTTSVTLNQAFMDAAYTIVKYILVGIVVAYATGHPGGDGHRGKDTGGGQ
jgi:hypothetical protein